MADPYASIAVTSFRSHGYTPTTEPQYVLSIVDRGMANFVQNPWLTRRLGRTLGRIGTEAGRTCRWQQICWLEPGGSAPSKPPR
jgi:hypothetical protein